MRPGAGLPQPHARPRRLDPLRLRQDPEPLLVPADQEGQRPRRGLLRPHQRHRRRRRPARSPARRSTRCSRWTRATGPAAPGCSLSSPESRFPRAQVWGDVAAVARIDAAYGQAALRERRRPGSVIGSPGTEFLWAGGRLLDAWPANPDEKEYNRVRDSNVETLLISGQLDFATPPQNATRQLLPHLPNGHQVVLPKLGHADDFWAYQPDAVHPADRHVPRQRPRRHLPVHHQPARLHPPTPSQATIAEIVVSVFLGFAGLAVLSLLWFARRLQRGATFGRKTSVAVRSLLPLLLGFGGWCLGVLIAMVALPTVPITDETLAVVSIAPPVALAVYTGWFRSAAPRGVAAFAAIARAALGAWLGYQVPHAPGVGAVTAIIAAILAANLGLIALDIAAPVTADATVHGSARAETVPRPA